MALKPCSNCGRMVSTKAPRCPKCGLKDPTSGKGELENALFSPDSIRVPTVECPECHRQVREGIKRCPYCGLKEPGHRPLRWRLPMLVALVAIIAAAVWGGTQWFSSQSELESGLISKGGQPSPLPPRVRAFGFGAHCADPAPVYVFAAGSIPDTFFVILEPRGADPLPLTRALAKKYRFPAGAFDRARRGFAARLSPEAVARLRCDPAVKWLEEEPTKSYPDRPGP